jgi:tRNA-dependent cyclodipeptide synthase
MTLKYNMNLQIFNSTQEELSHTKFPVFIGISVGVKPMSLDIALSYLNWAEEHSSDVVHILIADEIARYNYQVFSHYTKSGCLSRAIRDGDVYNNFFEKVIASLAPEKRDRFKIVRWRDIKGKEFAAALQAVREEFEKNSLFRKEILSILEVYIKRRGKLITDVQKELLCQYLLEELPTLLNGIYVNNKNYSLILYPTYSHSGMSQLVSDIQNKRKYVALGEKLCLTKTIMVESIIEEGAKNCTSLLTLS